MTKNIKIQLYGTVEGYLTLTEDSDFPFTLALADIKDLSKRKSTTSKSINIAGTDENNKLLGYYFDVNLDPNELSFNINKIQKCCIYVNDDMFMDNCIMQLTEIQKVQPNSQREYSIKYVINIKSNQADFFGSIQNKNLEDIELTTQDIPGNGTGTFIYNANFVKNSFNNTYIDGYKFIYQKTTNGKITLPMFKPAVYLWTYFNRIIKDAGFRYTFPEIGVTNSVLTDPIRDDLFFRKLLVPFTNKAEGTTMDNVVNYAANASRVGSPFQINGWYTITGGLFQYPGSLLPASIIPNTNEINDPSNSYTPTQYTAQYTGVLNINVNQRYQAFINNNNAFDIFTRFGNLNDGYAKFKVKNRIYKNGVDTGIETISGNVIITSSAHTWTAASRTSIGIDVVNTNLSVSVVPGDVITVRTSFVIEEGDGAKRHKMINSSGALVGEFRPEVDIQSMSLTYSASIPNSGLSFGGIIDLNNFIPQKIKQNDFLKSILNMHNIYVYSDKYDDNLLHFTTRDNYYDTGIKKNFTSKFCKDMEHTDQFLSELSNKEMYMTYKQDKNIDNEEYFNEYNKTYGSATFIFDNEYVKDEDKLEIIFSPSPINMDGDKYVTDLSTPDSLRLLFDGGESSCNAYNIVNYASNELTVNTYPITTHLNNPNIPTYDLNWGTAQSYFHTYSSITNNNLINTYWRRTLHQINKSRLLTCYLNLSEVDIRNINLNDIIYIDNTYYYINKIIDFNPVKTYKTKVELISIDDLQNTTKGLITNWGDTKPAEPWVPIPNGGTIKPSKYDNIIRDFVNGNAGTVGGVIGIGNVADSTSIIIGNYSVADGKGSIVIGDKSFISGSMTKSLGNNNIVSGNNVSVSGFDNNIVANNVIANGDNNILESPGIYLGSNITAPTNLNNVLVVGDNITPTGEGIWTDSINGIPASSITSPDLATVLANGNTTGANDIIIDSGQVITDPAYTSSLTLDLNLGQITGGSSFAKFNNAAAFITGPEILLTSQGITTAKSIVVDDTTIDFRSRNGSPVDNIVMSITYNNINLNYAPTTNNTNTKVLSRNTSTGNIEEIDVTAIPGTLQDLDSVLSTGNVTGGNNILITSGDILSSIDGTSKLSIDSMYGVLGIDDGAGTNVLVGLLPTLAALALNTPTTNSAYAINPGQLVMSMYDAGGFDYSVTIDSSGITFRENIGGDTPLIVDTAGVNINVGLRLLYTPVTNNSNLLLLSRNAATGEVELVDKSTIDTNFAEDNLIFTGNRTHNASGFNLHLTNLEHFHITGTSGNQVRMIIDAPNATDPKILSFRTNNLQRFAIRVDGVNDDIAFRNYDNTGTFTQAPILINRTTNVITFNEVYSFPTSDGTSGQVLTTDGAGSVSWQTPAGGSGISKYAATINLSAGNNVITHSLGNTDITVTLYDSTGVQVIPDEVYGATTTQVTIRISSAMSSARVIVIG